MSLDMWFTI